MSKKELVKNVIEFIEKELGMGKTYSRQQKLMMGNALLNQPDRAIENAVDWLILNSTPGNLPPPQRFLDSVEIERKKLSMADADERQQASDKRRKDSPNVFNTPTNTDIGRRTIRMMNKLFTEEPDYADILHDCEQLAKLYPQTEFHKLAEDWRQEWTQLGRL